MGTLADINLAQIKADFALRHVVEVGCGDGSGIDLAAGLGFDHVHAIESQHKLALQTALRHSARQDITIIHARGEKGLREALEDIPAESPVLFRFDYDYPGADARLLTDPEGRLQSEMTALSALRDLSRDVFLIDDLSLFPQSAAVMAECLPRHMINRSPQGTGILIAIPNGN